MFVPNFVFFLQGEPHHYILRFMPQICILSYLQIILLLLLSHFSLVRLCVTPETAAHQAPLSLGFSRQALEWVAISFSKSQLQFTEIPARGHGDGEPQGCKLADPSRRETLLG